MSTTTRPLFARDESEPVVFRTDDELVALLERYPAGPTRKAVLAEQARRRDVARAVELWERLVAVDFVRGETQGYYQHSTAYLSPVGPYREGYTKRMPTAVEIEALVLSDGEETAYVPHDAQLAYDPSEEGLTPAQRAETYFVQDRNEWSGDDRLYPIELTLIHCGGSQGSDVDAANNRSLGEFVGVSFREPESHDTFNVTTVQLGDMTAFANAQSDEPSREDALLWLETLVDAIEDLVEYPFVSEETHSNLVDELAEAAWDDWLGDDVKDRLPAMCSDRDFPCTVEGVECVDTEDVVDALWAAKESLVRAAYYEYEENEWTVENMGEGASNGNHVDAVKYAAGLVFGWDVDSALVATAIEETQEREYRAEFYGVFSAFLAQYPLPWLDRWGTHTAPEFFFAKLPRGGYSVEAIRALFEAEAERAAHKENESK